MAYKELLESKGFCLNTYPEGKFWELQVEEDKKLKAKICHIFGSELGLYESSNDIDIIILQCAEDYSKCVFYFDCNPFRMETAEFIGCTYKI